MEYIVVLPNAVPGELYARLGDGHVPDFIKNGISLAYSGVPKTRHVFAGSPRKAISDVFHSANLPEVHARSLTRMFSDSGDKFTFEIPTFERHALDGNNHEVKISVERARTFQQMELAVDMSGVLGRDVGECYDIAVKTLGK